MLQPAFESAVWNARAQLILKEIIDSLIQFLNEKQVFLPN